MESNFPKNYRWLSWRKFVLDRVKNILGKGHNAYHKHFSFSLDDFSKGCFSWVVKTWECLVRG